MESKGFKGPKRLKNERQIWRGIVLSTSPPKVGQADKSSIYMKKKWSCATERPTVASEVECHSARSNGEWTMFTQAFQDAVLGASSAAKTIRVIDEADI